MSAAPRQNPAADSSETTATPLLRGLYFSDASLRDIRAAIDREPWRAALLDDITSAADVWLARSDEWIREVLPAPGSLFAYGNMGCPKCGGKFGWFGANACSFDNPGKVVCPTCSTVYPDPDPSSPYHDTGRGVLVEGRRYYFTAVWNAWVVEQMYSFFKSDTAAVNILASAHALTGREEYARKAIVIMDALATLQPTTRGPRDFDTDDTQSKDQGRFHLLSSIVNRAQVPLARSVDIVGNHPLMAAESPTKPGVTITDNIRGGLFEDYLFNHYDIRGARLQSLHNHEADAVRAMIVVGLLYGDADMIRWGMQCLEALLENTVDRDGMYYETSLGYSLFTRGVFTDMAELLANYRPEKYEGVPGDFPPARNFFDHPKLRKLVADNFDMDLLGRRVSFGNSHGDDLVIEKAPESYNSNQWGLLARMGRHTSDAALRARVARVLAAGVNTADPDPVGLRWWLLHNPDPLPAKAGDTAEFNMFGNGRYFSTKAMAVFQFGDWPHKRALLVRGGPNLPHSHDDSLGLNLYDLGRDLSAEIGYGTFGTPLHNGWANRAISHCLVTIDGDAGQEGNEHYKKTPGATFRTFHNGDVVKFMDADSSSQFPQHRLPVEKFRRRIAAVVVDDARTYYVDLFDVKGGSVRDYSFHAPDHDELLTGALTLEGIEPEPVDGAWTLAGLDAEFRNASWNAPGRSWGERVVGAEAIRAVDPPDTTGNYGSTPPGRGYGFLYNLRGARTDKPWAATWKLRGTDNAHVRAGFFPTRAMDAYTANAPDRLNKKLFNYAVCRDGGTSESRFLVVIEPYRDRRAIASIKPVKNPTTGAVVLQVKLDDGRTDILVFGEDAREKVEFEGGSATAEMAFLRLDKSGKPLHATMARGTSVVAGRTTLLATGSPAVEGRVASIDMRDGSFVLEAPGLRGARLAGADPAGGAVSHDGVSLGTAKVAGGTATAIAPVAVVWGEGYPTSATMELKAGPTRPGLSVADGNRLRVHADGVILQQFRADAIDETSGIVTSGIPLPLGFVHNKSTRMTHGRHIADPQGRPVGRVARTIDLLKFEVTPDTRLAKGGVYYVMDVMPGHAVELPVSASWDAEK